MGLTEIKELRPKLMAAAAKHQEALFPARLQTLQAAYRRPAAWDQAMAAFLTLLRSWPEEREAASLGICFRQTDALMRRCGYRLVLYGEAFYLEETPAEQYWEPPGFSGCYEADIAAIMSGLKADFPRLRPYEEEAVRRQAGEYYHAAAYILSKALIPSLLLRDEFARINKTSGFFIFFGHYRGEGGILLTLPEAGKETDHEK